MVSSAMPVRVYRGFDKLVEALYGQHDWYLWWEQLPAARPPPAPHPPATPAPGR